MGSRNESLAAERLHLPESLVLVVFLFWWHGSAGVSMSVQEICVLWVCRSFYSTVKDEFIFTINNWSYTAWD